MYLCEGQKWDLEFEVRKRDWEVLQKKKKETLQMSSIYLLLYVFFFFSKIITMDIDHFCTKNTKETLTNTFSHTHIPDYRLQIHKEIGHDYIHSTLINEHNNFSKTNIRKKII